MRKKLPGGKNAVWGTHASRDELPGLASSFNSMSSAPTPRHRVTDGAREARG